MSNDADATIANLCELALSAVRMTPGAEVASLVVASDGTAAVALQTYSGVLVAQHSMRCREDGTWVVGEQR